MTFLRLLRASFVPLLLVAELEVFLWPLAELEYQLFNKPQ